MASQEPKIFYCLHMVEGVAEYHTPSFDGRILVLENAIKRMNPTFAGKPVYVKHVDAVDLKNLQEEADGYVIESFFNKADGKHWAKFIAVSDAAHEAISKGWKVSNCYAPKEMAGGGTWHAVEYSKEVMSGEYEHLAIVNDPRYEESIIFTPEQFKSYNQSKEAELLRLANSKETTVKFWNRNKVEDAEAKKLEAVVVSLKSGREVSITQLVNEADASEEKKGMANGADKVKVGEDKEMTVNELVEHYKSSMKNEDDKEENSKEDEEEKKNEKGDEEEKKNADDKEEEKKNEETEEEKKKKLAASKKNSKNFDSLKNARETAAREEENTFLDTPQDQLSRGQSRYGSSK